MKTMTVAEFKARFSEVLESVKHGESIAVTYGRSKRTVAMVEPPRKKRTRRPRADDPIYRMCEFAETVGPAISNDEMDRLIYGV